MEKLTYDEATRYLIDFNKKHGTSKICEVVAVITEESFTKLYKDIENMTLETRSFGFTNNNKAFIEDAGGYSIFAGNLDKTEPMIRLDLVLVEETGLNNGLEVEYCYIKYEDR